MAAATFETFRATPWFVNFQDFEYEELYIKNVKPTKWIAASDLVLPDGWPKSLDSGLAWDGMNLMHEKYVVELSNDDNMIISAALRSFKGLGLDGNQIDRASFPLPGLDSRLDELALMLYQRQGMAVIRGLVHASYSAEDKVVIFLGISAYIGNQRGKQDEEGNMLVHVSDAKTMQTPQCLRPTRDSNTSLSFHSDKFCDILAMQVDTVAAQGGKCIVSSAWKVYNELAKNRPDLVTVLAEPNWKIRTNDTTETRALLYHIDSRVILNYVPRQILGPDQSGSALSDKQLEALVSVELLARQYQLKLDTNIGDIIFMNNYAVLHSREAFTDDAEHQRHLVRLWLKNESLAWTLPAALETGSKRIYQEDEEDGVEEKWVIIPAPRTHFEERHYFDP